MPLKLLLLHFSLLHSCRSIQTITAILKWILYFIMRYKHDDKVPFAATSQVSVAVFVVATKVEATAASVLPQFLDLFKPSVLLQLQHRSACYR